MNLILPTDRLNLPEADQKIVQSWQCDEVQLKPYDPKRDRTNKANRYYWGVVLKTMAGELGYRTEDLHEALKQKLLPRSYVMFGGEEVEIRKSTATLNTEEFGQYIEAVIAQAGELGISIPESQ